MRGKQLMCVTVAWKSIELNDVTGFDATTHQYPPIPVIQISYSMKWSTYHCFSENGTASRWRSNAWMHTLLWSAMCECASFHTLVLHHKETLLLYEMFPFQLIFDPKNSFHWFLTAKILFTSSQPRIISVSRFSNILCDVANRRQEFYVNGKKVRVLNGGRVLLR